MLLSAALLAMPLGAALHRSEPVDGVGVGMATRLPVALEVGKSFSLSAPSQTRPDGVAFEVALLGISAVLWRLVGRFLQIGTSDTPRDLLIKYGTLQLEGG